MPIVTARKFVGGLKENLDWPLPEGQGLPPGVPTRLTFYSVAYTPVGA